jgi:hypothetical protein
MRFIQSKDFRLSPGSIWKLLAREKELIITSNGRPIAVLSFTDEDSVEETLEALRRAKAEISLKELRKSAIGNGTDKLSEKDIDHEIKKYRREKRK